MIKLRVEICCMALVVLCSTPSVATTVVIFVTPHGIALGTDSRMTQHSVTLGMTSARASVDDAKKIICVQERILVASIGKGYLANQGQHLHYDFDSWMEQLDRSLPKNVSVEGLASTIEAESSKMLASFDIPSLLRSGVVRNNDRTNRFELFVEYVVVGYQANKPRLYTIQFYVDWDENKLIGPRLSLMDSGDDSRGNIRMYPFGVTEGFADLLSPDSFAYKQTTLACPTAFSHLLAHNGISLTDTISLAHALVEIEEEVNPSDVGGEVQVAQILPAGRASFVTNASNEITPRSTGEPAR